MSTIQGFPRQIWSLSRLQHAVHRLIDLDDLPFKLCLFIDGLDEFEGHDDQNDWGYLIELFTRLGTSSHIKVCLSSRPFLIFEESFKHTPGLRLQDLTSGDIRRYMIDRLSTDLRMRQLADHEPSQKHDFVRQICNKAQGVFLWVKLVTRSLLDGLHNSDHIADLRARLDLLPADLKDLYRHMISQIENLYLIQASQVFRMVQAARRVQAIARTDNQRTTPVTVLLLALATERDSEASIETASNSWTAKKLSLLCDVMRRRLQTWCAGLIEVPDFIWNRVDALDDKAGLRTKITWEVAYIHRIARDFIESDYMWNLLL